VFGVVSETVIAGELGACPDCPTARLVRASLFDGSFWIDLLLVSLPLLVLGLISALFYRIGAAPDSKTSGTAVAGERRS